MDASTLEELGAVFADALTEIVAKVSGFSLDVLSSSPDDDFGDAAGFMSLGGKRGGALFITAGEADLRLLCSFMTGVPEGEVTREETRDALCELVNMTVGNVKLRLGDSEYAPTLSMPFVINGENMSLVTKKRVRVIARSLGNGEITVRLKLLF